jgi:hypothetical protein
MENEKKGYGRLMPFLIGLIIGNKGLPIMVHIFYLFIIAFLLYKCFIK